MFSVPRLFWLLCVFRAVKVCSIYVLGAEDVLVTLRFQSYEGLFDLCFGDYGVLVTLLIQSYESLFDPCSR